MGSKDKFTDENNKTSAEGFEDKVNRLAGQTNSVRDTVADSDDEGLAEKTADKVDQVADEMADKTKKQPHEAIFVTENHSMEPTTSPAIQVIKKRSLAGLLGFLFGAAALSAVAYFYYQQYGWQWPPATSNGRVKQADLTALENRLRHDLQSTIDQRIEAKLKQLPPPAAKANEELTGLRGELTDLRDQLSALQIASQNPAVSAPDGQAAVTDHLTETLIPLQEQVQQLSNETKSLSEALEAQQQRHAEQLATLQQQLSQLQEKATSQPAATTLPAQDLARVARQLHLQQAANALNNAQLALQIQHRPQAAAIALQHAATELQQAGATELASAVQSAHSQLENSQPTGNELEALTSTMQAISRWHWQPPASKTPNGNQARDKTGWLSNLIVIKKIDQPQQAAMTLAEENALKQDVLDALSAASLAYQQGKQTRWQQQLKRAIDRLQPLAASQPPLARAITQLQALQQQDITPQWPDLTPLQQQLEALQANGQATAIPENTANSESTPL